MSEKLTVQEARALMTQYMRDNPNIIYKLVGEKFGYSASYVYQLAKKANLTPRKRGRQVSKIDRGTTQDPSETVKRKTIS